MDGVQVRVCLEILMDQQVERVPTGYIPVRCVLILNMIRVLQCSVIHVPIHQDTDGAYLLARVRKEILMDRRAERVLTGLIPMINARLLHLLHLQLHVINVRPVII
jgi:hypothetical protein